MVADGEAAFDDDDITTLANGAIALVEELTEGDCTALLN